MKVEALHYCYGESGPCHPFFGVKMFRLNTCHKFGPYPPCTPFNLKGFDEGTVQSLKSQDLWRTNSKGYRMSGKVYQTHVKCFFFSLLLFLPPKLQKYANF